MRLRSTFRQTWLVVIVGLAFVAVRFGRQRLREFTAPLPSAVEQRAFVHSCGHTATCRRLHPTRRTWEYSLPKGVCAACPLRPQCTRASSGRTIHRHEHQALLDRARQQAHSAAARRDRQRRQHLAEVSFADATNHHGFKRARWRPLWRVQIQDWLIAAIQNVKILLKRRLPPVATAAGALLATHFTNPCSSDNPHDCIPNDPLNKTSLWATRLIDLTLFSYATVTIAVSCLP